MAERPVDPFFMVTDPDGYEHIVTAKDLAELLKSQRIDPMRISRNLLESAIALKYAREALADKMPAPATIAIVKTMLEDARGQISAAIDAIIEYEETKG